MIYNNEKVERILEFDLNNELYLEIIKDMPKNMTNIEKTIYVYLKMCTLFTYDEKFFVTNQIDNENIKHSELNHLSEISLSNNQIICYEFNAIFAKILDKMGYKFMIDLKDSNCLIYGYGHTSLTYYCDEYTVSADAVTSIFCGDLQLVKRGKPPIGLNCLNNKIDIRREFGYAVEEMTGLIRDQIYRKCDFSSKLDNYHQIIHNDITNLDVIAIMNELLKLLFKENLTGIDAIGYIVMLSRGLINSKLGKCLSISIVAELVNGNYVPTVIFTINNNNIVNYKDNIYLCFNTPDKFRKYNYDELQLLFDNQVFHLKNKDVPGIIEIDDEKTKVKILR